MQDRIYLTELVIKKSTISTIMRPQSRYASASSTKEQFYYARLGAEN